MNRIIFSTTLTLAAVTPFAMRGADFDESPNRFSLGARFGMNFKAAFRNNGASGPVAAAADPGPPTGGVDHNYNDGYVHVDSSGNGGGMTWNWGYQNASQVVGDTMEFHAVQTDAITGSGERKGSGDPQWGAELIYQRVIGRISFLPSARWGLEAGFGYTDLDLHNNLNGSGPVTLTTDAYGLGGSLAPGAGYQGTFDGPGILLDDVPVRTSTSANATLSSHHKLSGQLYNIRLGPFAEFYLTHQLSLAVSAGITLAPSSVSYDFSESTTLDTGGTLVESGHSSRTKLLYGPYVSAMARYDFNPSWGVYIGAQFQSLTSMEQSVAGRSAKLDQGATFYGTAGITFRF